MTLAVLISFLPASPARTAEASELPSIEQQIRAFADSIDQADADDAAASAMAMHGITGGGKKLSAGKNHSLTATLLNSELAQVALSRFCENAIRSMQQLDLDALADARGDITWHGTADSYFYLRAYESPNVPEKQYAFTPVSTTHYAANRNGYDNALDWMAGITRVKMSFKRSRVTANTVTYQVNLKFSDRFDFATSGSDFFKDLISGLGALMFREFDWEATVSFDIEVPYSCPHETQMYRLTYDKETKTMTSDTSGSWQANDATRRIYTSDGEDSDYYELAKPVRLRHNAPWVMEFDVRNSNVFAFSPLPETNYSYPVLHNNRRTFLALCDYDRVPVSQAIMDQYGLTSDYQTIRHYYGTSLNDRFSYSLQKTYTFRLENELRADGGNMIYLTVRETYTGAVMLDRIPMDDYHLYESWIKERILQDEHSEWVSGKDLIINFIGYTTYRFSADHFELRVWENGQDRETISYYQSKVTAPTCTSQGYTTHTCSRCGYSYNDAYVDALGHSFSDWEITGEPGCLEQGSRSRSCARCSHTEQENIAALGHKFGGYVSDGNATCLEDGTVTGFCSRCGLTDTQPDPGSAAGHSMTPWQTRTAPGCLSDGEEIRLCENCDHAESQVIPALGHSHEAAVTPPTCTAQGFTTHTCSRCGDSFADSYTDPLGHSWEDSGAIHLECTRCGYAEGGFPVVLEVPEEENPEQTPGVPTEIWADGVKYPLKQENGQYIVYLPREDTTNLVIYTTNENATEDVHTQYPVGMKVWLLKYENDAYTATHIPEFDNLLTYAGSSIRIVGVKGIRMITGIAKEVKTALTGDGLAGYTLAEYGTALAWASEVDPALGLTLGQSYTKSNFAYKKGEADPVFKQTPTHIQYTNVLVGFDDDQCIPDIAMRPYMILEDAQGNRITVYGGVIYRNIGYIAWQNRTAFRSGTAAYEYVWGIIHHVYGDRFDQEYGK